MNLSPPCAASSARARWRWPVAGGGGEVSEGTGTSSYVKTVEVGFDGKEVLAYEGMVPLGNMGQLLVQLLYAAVTLAGEVGVTVVLKRAPTMRAQSSAMAMPEAAAFWKVWRSGQMAVLLGHTGMVSETLRCKKGKTGGENK